MVISVKFSSLHLPVCSSQTCDSSHEQLGAASTQLAGASSCKKKKSKFPLLQTDLKALC